MKFSLTTVLLLVSSIGIACGWYADRTKLSRQLEAMSKAEAFDQLCNSVNIENLFGRLDGIGKLHRHGGESVLPPLIYALGDPEITIAKSARNALESLTEASFRDAAVSDSNEKHLLYEWGQWIDWYANRHDVRPIKDFPQFAMDVQAELQAKAIERLEGSIEHQ